MAEQRPVPVVTIGEPGPSSNDWRTRCLLTSHTKPFGQRHCHGGVTMPSDERGQWPISASPIRSATSRSPWESLPIRAVSTRTRHGRIIHLLASHGIFQLRGTGWAHTAASRLLREHHPMTMRLSE